MVAIEETGIDGGTEVLRDEEGISRGFCG